MDLAVRGHLSGKTGKFSAEIILALGGLLAGHLFFNLKGFCFFTTFVRLSNRFRMPDGILTLSWIDRLVRQSTDHKTAVQPEWRSIYEHCSEQKIRNRIKQARKNVVRHNRLDPVVWVTGTRNKSWSQNILPVSRYDSSAHKWEWNGINAQHNILLNTYNYFVHHFQTNYSNLTIEAWGSVYPIKGSVSVSICVRVWCGSALRGLHSYSHIW